ncbi:hypothetical protein ES705_15342 [subsurface metagenome]
MREDEKKRIIIRPGEATFKEYLDVMIQRIPKHLRKALGRKRWRTQNWVLSDSRIRDHLEGKYDIATLGRWYPEYAILDIDSRTKREVDEIRETLGLDELNSMLMKSESEDSYHLIFPPEYHGKPPTLNLLKDSFMEFCKSKRIEIYPQRRRPIRLPFGPHQPLLDIEYMRLESWKEKLYSFQKLNPFDLGSVKYHQLIFDFEPGPGKLLLPTNIFQEAQDLLDHGLQFPSSRHDSQGLILFYLWRKNIPVENAIEIVWNWISEKHNGFSKDILRSPRYVRKDIESQAHWTWNKYQVSQVYPDSTHKKHHGYITEPDIPDIVEATSGSWPRMKFLYNLIKFSYPRRHRRLISIHRDRLVKWSSTETYQKYLNELGEKGIAERGSAYLAEGLPGSRGFAKNLKLNWKFRSSNEAIMHEGRATETFEGTIKFMFKKKPYEFRQQLIKVGVKQSTASERINSIWRKD